MLDVQSVSAKLKDGAKADVHSGPARDNAECIQHFVGCPIRTKRLRKKFLKKLWDMLRSTKDAAFKAIGIMNPSLGYKIIKLVGSEEVQHDV